VTAPDNLIGQCQSQHRKVRQTADLAQNKKLKLYQAAGDPACGNDNPRAVDRCRAG
jgi:hypothetical protein